MNTNLYTTKTPPDALHALAQIRVLTSRGWHMQIGNILLAFEWLFYLLAAIWIVAAIMLSETTLTGILQDLQENTLQVKDNTPEPGAMFYMAVKILMAVLGLFSLAVGLLLRKWHRKNKLLAKVHALTENFVDSR
jgi:hypothetical protein